MEDGKGIFMVSENKLRRRIFLELKACCAPLRRKTFSKQEDNKERAFRSRILNFLTFSGRL
jgi:hypothetical protein